MIQRYDANGFPLPDVPTDGRYNVDFGGEANYALRGPKSAVADLEAKAIANNTSTDRTPASGKYIYDSATGQYIWVPATAVAPVGLAASPAYQDRSGPGGGSELGATNNSNYGGVNTNKGIVEGILSSTMMGRIANALGSKQDPTNVTVESRTGIPTGLSDNTVTGVNDLGVSDRNMAAMRGQESFSGYSSATPTVGTGGFGKPGETALGGYGYAPSTTNNGLTSRGIGISSGVTTDVDSAVDAAPPSDSDTGKDTGADSVSGGGGGGGGPRVICTHFYRKGEMDRDMWRADLEFTFKHLSPTTVRGYQYWAIPYVKLMRKSKLAEDIIRPLAFARAKELTYQMGRSPKGSVFGKVVRLVCEPICFAVGLFVGEQNWQALWTPVKD